MTKSFVMPTKEKAKLDAYKACLDTRLVGSRKFEVIKTLQLSNYGCWQAALSVVRMVGLGREYGFNLEGDSQIWGEDFFDFEGFLNSN